MRFPFQFCKRSLMLLVLFSAMGLAFSIGLITSVYPFEIAVTSIAGVVTVLQLINFLTNLKMYFHFDKTFDLSNRKVKYIVATIILTRIAQALVISVLRNSTFTAACIILGLQVMLAMSVLIFRPYIKTFYNMLTIIGEWTVTGFLSISLVLNLDFITSMET